MTHYVPLDNFGIISPTIGRCAQPDAHGFRQLAQMGYTLIAKLNTEEESSVGKEALLFGTRVGRSIASFPNLSPLDPDVAIMRLIAGEIIRLNAAGEKILIHCTHGRDRTGMVCAAIRILRDKWVITDVLAEFRDYGESPWPMVAQRYRNAIRQLANE